MCGVCGCGQATVEGLPSPLRQSPGLHPHEHDDQHEGEPHHGHGPGQGQGPAPVEAGSARADEARRIRVERDILAENDRLAAANRAFFRARGVLALTLLSAPGSGKTTLLVRTLRDLKETGPIAVIEGDQQTDLDAERIRATGVPAAQINTGKGCHLNAAMVGRATAALAPHPGTLVFIENVGNLVCPAAFDLGEGHRVVVVSVTEGDDKPLKYPDVFHGADLMVITKIDLLAHVAFDVERCVALARRINPGLTALSVSATAGLGLDGWYDWIAARRRVPGDDGTVPA